MLVFQIIVAFFGFIIGYLIVDTVPYVFNHFASKIDAFKKHETARELICIIITAFTLFLWSKWLLNALLSL